MNDTGPEAIPFVDFTISPLGRIFEKENPTPPPDLCINAIYFSELNMPLIESLIGKTKQADN
ncbi:MAG: hypothetical protein Kow0019_01310 [Methanobacteriaceae archaeon]